MHAKYILRFDDVCPTMNWHVWDQVEALLRHENIRPIVAVIPDNRDDSLCVAPPSRDFWGRVRAWSQLGWTVAVHGYQHAYSTTDEGIIGLNDRSEFAGVDRPIQASRLNAALKIFHAQSIYPTTWVAPGHSFDWNTVDCLKELGVRVISDGFFLRPVRQNGCTWLPQQLWRLRWMPAGVWTVCYHINAWRERDIQAFARDLQTYRNQVTSVERVLERRVGEMHTTDRLCSSLFKQLVLMKRLISRK